MVSGGPLVAATFYQPSFNSARTPKCKHCLGKNIKQTEKFDEIGAMLVLGAQVDTKKIRKAGADIFAIVGFEKP